MNTCCKVCRLAMTLIKMLDITINSHFVTAKSEGINKFADNLLAGCLLVTFHLERSLAY